MKLAIIPLNTAEPALEHLNGKALNLSKLTQLEPDEILVCPGTDPAWTLLFLAAGGLIMEVGGMMTRAAIVTREYGIPAVVGVGRVTERLETGDLIRVDGSTGLIQKINSGK